MRLYLDADVWLNFWLDEMLGFLPASHYTEQLLKKAIDQGWTLVVSEEVKIEVTEAGVSLQDFEEKLLKFKELNILQEVETREDDDKFARKILRERKLHFSDALHAALAIKAKAIIVTRNIKHFEKVSDLVEIRKPEDLL